MTASDPLAQRHFLAASGLRPASDVRHLMISIIIPPEVVATAPGQLLSSCLVNLLVRQMGTVRALRIVCPPAACIVPLPAPDLGADFPAALVGLARWAVKDRVDVALSSLEVVTQSDLIVHVGCPTRLGGQVQGRQIVTGGNGWRAWIGALDHYRAFSMTSSNPLGPFLAAALAAGEIFKEARGIVRGKILDRAGYSLWSGTGSGTWSDLPDGPALAGHAPPPMHLVGAGAVGNGLAYVLGSSGLGGAALAIIDDDAYDGTNLNRCFLAGHEDVDHPKVEAVARFLRSTSLQAYPFRGKVSEYVLGAPANFGTDLKREADLLQFGLFVSCVDRGDSRQDIQGLWPKLILGGSTLNLVARADIYRGSSEDACLGCHNPAERDGDRAHAFREQLKSMPQERRRAFLAAQGLDPVAIEDELGRPQCGSVAEADVAQLSKPPPIFSVGFVSLSAALLLASNLYREAFWPHGAPARRSTITLAFLNGEMEQSKIAIDDACERHCQNRHLARQLTLASVGCAIAR